MTDGMDYRQFQNFYDNFSKINKEFENWLKNFLLQQAQRCIGRTKSRQRAKGFIDTGYMVNNWAVGEIRQVGNSLEITVGNSADYASYIEYGHSLRNGGWFQGGFMLTISIDEIERAMPSRFQKSFIEFLKKWGY